MSDGTSVDFPTSLWLVARVALFALATLRRAGVERRVAPPPPRARERRRSLRPPPPGPFPSPGKPLSLCLLSGCGGLFLAAATVRALLVLATSLGSTPYRCGPSRRGFLSHGTSSCCTGLAHIYRRSRCNGSLRLLCWNPIHPCWGIC